MKKQIKALIKKLYYRIFIFTPPIIQNNYWRLIPTKLKRQKEFAYWRSLSKNIHDVFNAKIQSHFQVLYTSVFNLTIDSYNNKNILDIGCGPGGSLAWATQSTNRIGIDPLAIKYLEIGANPNKQTYITAVSEALPFVSDCFDIVSSFNSLDHVDRMNDTISEIKRVVKTKGLFLLIVEINHPPTPTEPFMFPWNVTETFLDTFELIEYRKFEIGDHDIYKQVLINNIYNESDRTMRSGILAAKFIKE